MAIRRDDRRREEILQTATHLFSEKGFQKTKLDDIANAIGFSKPAIYHYFRGKQDILYSIRFKIVSRALDNLESLLEGPGTPSEKLVAALEAQVRIAVVNIGAWTVFHEARGLLSEDREGEVRAIERRYEHRLRELYQLGVDSGELVGEDARLAVDTLLGACNYVYRWYRGEAVDAFARRIVALLASGVVAPAARMPVRFRHANIEMDTG